MKRITVIILAMVALGCAKHPTLVHDFPPSPEGGYFDMVWVEPRVVMSEPEYTLIAADRLDSIYVDQPPNLNAPAIPSVTFRVLEEICFVAVNLENSEGKIVYPLIAENLPTGYYKLTIAKSRFSSDDFGDPVYYLHSWSCGRKNKKPVVLSN